MTTAREETARLADLLRDEQHALAEFIAALADFDAERRWVELGYSSLFYFLVRELGLSKGAAFYRKTAAELVQRFPEVLVALREGKLCMTGIVELAKVLTPENRDEVLPRFFHLSKTGAKEVTAALLPAATPPLRTVVTAVEVDPAALASDFVAPVAAGRTDAVSQNVKDQAGWPANLGHANASVPGVASTVPCSSSLAPVPPLLLAPAPAQASAMRRRADVEPLTGELARIHVTVPKRLLQKLAAARDALSHSHPGASDDEILELGLDLIAERYRKRRGIGAKPRNRASATDPATAPVVASTRAPATGEGTATPQAPTAAAVPAPASVAAPPPAFPQKRSRHVPADVWRAVWERDRGRCVWPANDGGICGSTSRLQLDHVRGLALGGTDDRRRVPDPVRLPPGRLRARAVRRRRHGSLHDAEARRSLLRGGRAVRRASVAKLVRVDDQGRCSARISVTASAWRRPRAPGTLDRSRTPTPSRTGRFFESVSARRSEPGSR